MRRLAALAAISLVLVACGSDATSSPGGTAAPVAGEPADTTSHGDLARTHVDGPVEYPQTPPVGGPHAGNWQDCQYYDTSVPNERAVHSMEHGAVWITYAPETAATDRQALQALAQTADHILVSEYQGLPSPIVASAWGKQLQLQSVADPALPQFVDVFESGPQTPEPGVTCRKSTSETT